MSRIGRVLVTVLCLLGMALPALASDWREKAAGPTFADMVKESANVVFAQITAVDRQAIKISVAKAIKGDVHDEIRVMGLSDMQYVKIQDPRQTFKSGEDYFLFLNAAMMGSVPFSPIKNSVFVKINRGKISTSVIAPSFASKYSHTFDYELFDGYLTALAAVQRGRNPEPAYLGLLMENFEKAAADPNSRLAPSYLLMINQIQPDYKNLDTLFAMLTNKDVNSRVAALQYLADYALTLRKAKAAALKEDAAPKPKKAHKGKKGQDDNNPYNKIFSRIVQVLKEDNSRLMQSTAAMALSRLQDPRAIDVLADRIDTTDETMVESCEMLPTGARATTRRAVLEAIVSFEAEAALDVLERELLKNKVETFRMILDIFKDYADNSLNLLLLDLLQDSNFLPRQVAILEYFRQTKDDAQIKSLMELFLSPDAGSEFIRKSIVEVFASYKQKKLIGPFLVENGLRDSNAVVRQAAALALGELSFKPAVAEIKKIYFKESNRLAREFYVEALSKIRSKEAYETLMWLDDKESDRRMKNQIKFALKKSKYLSQ